MHYTQDEYEKMAIALQRRYHLMWAYEYDLASAGGIIWYKPNGESFCVTGGDPLAVYEGLTQFIAECNITEPAYYKPLQQGVYPQGHHSAGYPFEEGALPEQMDLDYDTMIPIGDHPGAFGYRRKNHRHEGVDLYAKHGDEVYSMVAGKITNIIEHFTGPGANMPWWNKTSAVVIEDEEGVWIYGEIDVKPDLQIGQEVTKGQPIGNIATVLKQDKGRPMSMLHLERYTKGTTDSVGIWQLDAPKPDNLLDPTPLLIEGLGLEQNDND